MASATVSPWLLPPGRVIRPRAPCALAEDSQAMQVHARPVVDRDEDHEHAVAGPAADDRARRLQIDHKLGDRPGIAAGPADTGGACHLVPENLVQQAADGVPVDYFHQIPPVAPTRSVFTRCGG